MEDVMNCPVCNAVNKHYIQKEWGIGTVEEFYRCCNCGYFSEMAYSPTHEGIELFPFKKLLHQLIVLLKAHKRLRGLKIGKSRSYF